MLRYFAYYVCELKVVLLALNESEIVDRKESSSLSFKFNVPNSSARIALISVIWMGLKDEKSLKWTYRV